MSDLIREKGMFEVFTLPGAFLYIYIFRAFTIDHCAGDGRHPMSIHQRTNTETQWTNYHAGSSSRLKPLID